MKNLNLAIQLYNEVKKIDSNFTRLQTNETSTYNSIKIYFDTEYYNEVYKLLKTTLKEETNYFETIFSQDNEIVLELIKDEQKGRTSIIFKLETK